MTDYVDTNIVLARFAPKDPLQVVSKAFFNLKEERIVSPVSLLEMSAVLSRGNVTFDTPSFLRRENGARRVLALTEYFVGVLGLRVENVPVTSRLRIGGSTLTIPMEYAEALSKAGELKLRALDLLHVVYASMISKLRTRVDRFVTSDEGILDRGQAIEQQFGFSTVHPSDAARLN